jgi:two-component system cell cycle sensor histidine kinase/response regulator CckA
MMSSRKLPILVGAVAILAAVALWQELLAHERAQIARATESEAQFVRNRIAADMESRILSLARMTKRWETEGPPPESQWDSDASLLVNPQRGFQSIAWVDPSFRVQWISPLKGNEAGKGFDLSSREQERSFLQAARDRREGMVMRSIDPSTASQAFLICVPIFQGERFGGFLIGVFQLQAWLDALLEHVAPGYSIAVLDGKELIYLRSGDEPGDERLSQGTPLVARGRSWRVRVWPGLELAQVRSRLPYAVLISGLLVALLFAMAIYLAQTAWLREQQLAVANSVLKREITERKQAEEALVHSEENYRSLVQNAPVGIFRVSQDGERFLTVNRALVEMLGYDSEAELEAARPSADVFCAGAELQRFLEQHCGQEPLEGVEMEWKRKDGTLFTVHLTGRSVGGGLGDLKSFEVVAEDVTRRRSLEQRLRQAERMEAIGRLAGGVAHDFNNMLMIIQGSTQLLLDCLGRNDPLRRNLEDVLKAGERAASLTRQLLAFSRKQVLQPAVLDLNVLVAEAARMLPPLLGQNIEMVLSLDPALGRVKADPGQVQQIIMNLAVNARDAMPEGGELVLATKNVALQEPIAGGHDAIPPGSYVMLSVSDTGHGIDADIRSHIFEPFYSTKPRDKGTGLGLATVYGIVDQSGGHIQVETELARGTSFRIYLPRVADAVEVLRPSKVLSGSLRGSETVLVVEDDDGVRKLTREFLKISGYTVLEARNGAEAIQIPARHAGPVDLLLTDVLMPGMNGREVAQQFVSLRPETKVLFMSGYTEDAITHLGILEPGVAFIEKPFSPDELARKVRRVLGSKERTTAPAPQQSSQ